MEEKQAISGLKTQGWSDRRIAKELGLNRRTVARHAGSKCTKVQTGKADSRSQGAKYDTQIRQWSEAGLSIERIHHDLEREHAFKGSYHSVYRFGLGLDITESKRVYRMECEPAQEAPVDYGTLLLPVGDNRRLKKIHSC